MEWKDFFSVTGKSSYSLKARNEVLKFITSQYTYPTDINSSDLLKIGSASNYVKFHFDIEKGLFLNTYEERKKVDSLYLHNNLKSFVKLIFGEYFDVEDISTLETIIESIGIVNNKLYGKELESEIIKVVKRNGHIFFNI